MSFSFFRLENDKPMHDFFSEFVSFSPQDKLRVKVTLKMLHAPKENDLNQCVREFGIEKLFNQESKQTLSCINIPTFIPPAK